jgi:glycosyltransferase involved in cell wall biosynthesis
VCSDQGNLAWGRFRNGVADYQCTLGGNRVDCNDDPRVHEVPEFYCLDPDFWHPGIEIPEAFRIRGQPGAVRLFHSVGHLEERTDENGINIKTTHLWRPLMERLRGEGCPVEWLHFTNVANRDLRYYQVQADIFLDMLTFGWFGATAREAMMLAKPVICYIRPEWLESVRREIPEYAAELPIVSATPATAYETLKALVEDPERRAEIGRRSRAFALKWHGAEPGARRFDAIYGALLHDRPVPPR